MDPRQKPQRFKGSGALNRHCTRSGHGKNRSDTGTIGTPHAPVTGKSRRRSAPFLGCPPSSLPALLASDEGGFAAIQTACPARASSLRAPGTASMPVRMCTKGSSGHGWKRVQVGRRVFHCPGMAGYRKTVAARGATLTQVARGSCWGITPDRFSPPEAGGW